jgi:hypothetical protein
MIYKQQNPTDDFSNIDMVIKNSDLNLKHLKQIDAEQEKKGEKLLYRYFAVPVADGNVFYQVTKVGKRNVTVKLCPGICIDEYVDSIIGVESKLPIENVERLITSRIKLERFFK